MSSNDPPPPDRTDGPSSNPPEFLPPGYDAPADAYPLAPSSWPPVHPQQPPQAPPVHPQQPPQAPPVHPQQPTYPAQPSPQPAQPYPPQLYPQQTSGYPPQQPGWPQPYPQQASNYPPQQPVPGPQGQQAAPTVAPTERVGRGLLFSLGGIVVGVVLTVVLWKLNFVASITSFAMAYACVWLYARGAGSAPRKGVGGLIAVIVAGVVVSLGSIVVVDALDYVGSEYPSATLADKVDFVLFYIGLPQVWQEYTTQALMYLLFAALGTFGLIRQLGRTKGA